MIGLREPLTFVDVLDDDLFAATLVTNSVTIRAALFPR
jgi:hypothetical protein